jgi:TonB-linked SusC/RagA family outer membrane protein
MIKKSGLTKTSIVFAVILFCFVGLGNSPFLYASHDSQNGFLQQPGKISGWVTDKTGTPIPGVSIVVKGTTIGTISDNNGTFSLELPSDAMVLSFSFIGMNTQEITIGNQTIFNIVLEEAELNLDEVVVVGYGTQKKKLVTGATVQVKGENIQKLSTVSTLTALQSQTPGLSIISTSGRPDADFKINIRGLGTIGNAAPLIVINGIAGGDLRTLSPSDIESIDVLKDAASAAIYGSRAANGVILVTTKQGKAGKTSLSFDTYYGVQNIEKSLDMVNPKDYMTLVNEASVNSGGAPIDYEKILPPYLWDKIQSGWSGTNWWKELANVNAPVKNYALNINGGTDKSNYSMGISYTDQEAILGNPIKEKLERYSIRLNSEHVLYKKDGRNIIKFGENLLYTYKKNVNKMGNEWRWAGTSPIMPLTDSTGEYMKNTTYYDDRTNPVGFQYYNSSNEYKYHDLRSNAYFEIQPVKNLIFKSNIGYTVNAFSSRDYKPAYTLSTTVLDREFDEISQSQSLGIGYQFENTMTYNLKIKNLHNITALIGQSIEKTGLGESISGNNMGSIFDSYEYAYLSNVKTVASGPTTLSGEPLGEWAISSFFGRINYDYKETYLLSALIRRDGSSRFARGNRWGNFPSVSAGWVLSNESFMQSTSAWLNFLKMRISWGQNGNQDIPPFQYLSPFKFSGANYFFGTSKISPVIGAYPAILSNEGIKWETSEQLDFGVDSRFFKGKMQLSFDLYKKETKDWLVNAPILGSQGAGAPYINGGDITNKGFELALNWNDNVGDFTYGLSANFAYNENKITSIDNKQGLIEGTKINEYATGQVPPYRAQEGYPIGYFWGYKTAGIFQDSAQIADYKGAKIIKSGKGPKPGDLIFLDLNNDSIISSLDRTMIGNPNPKGIFGFSIYLGYKGIDFSVTAAGVYGNQILTSFHMADSYKENYPQYMMDRWSPENPDPNARYPRLTATPNPNYTYFSDIYMNDGDYLRIQNVSLGYDLKKLFQGIPVSQARIYVAAQNLYTFTKYIGPNPEVGADAGVGTVGSSWGKGIDVAFNPLPRTFMIGANLKF